LWGFCYNPTCALFSVGDFEISGAKRFTSKRLYELKSFERKKERAAGEEGGGAVERPRRKNNKKKKAVELEEGL
jgi:hypothetical protein